MTRKLFLEEPIATSATARVVEVRDEGVVLDATIFYATSGGQPGDRGTLDGARVVDTVYGPDRTTILHVLAEGEARPAVGDEVALLIDEDRRQGHSKMHTACHLLSVVCPYPVTGGSVGTSEARLDFDLSEAPDKTELTAALQALVDADHPVFARSISEAELDADPGLVKSKNVRPPRGTGRIRLVCIGDDASIDSQPCGGTHVARTGEIGAVHVSKVEKKGRENRRVRLRLGPAPA